jgi:hypothetical protein
VTRSVNMVGQMAAILLSTKMSMGEAYVNSVIPHWSRIFEMSSTQLVKRLQSSRGTENPTRARG